MYRVRRVELLERKGIFCYYYIDSFAWLNEPALPPREAFINKFKGVECSEADYDLAQEGYADFQCESLKDYILLYILSDICLLAMCSRCSETTCSTSTSWTRLTL